MDIKRETYCHLATLAVMGINDVAKPTSNSKLRALFSACGSFEKIYEKIRPSDSMGLAAKLVEAEEEINADASGYGMLTCNDSNFPAELQVSTTTPVLYYRGNLDLLKRERMAVVGTREDLNEQESAEAARILGHIQKQKYVIVSGLARGCDTLGHEAGLLNGTIAVIADPINDYYLKRNKALMEKIAKEHLLLSQFPIGLKDFFHPKYYHGTTLPRRNQTTVALSTKGVLVIKTKDDGGTQHAIRESQNLGKELYALRCNFTPENTWTNGFQWEDYGIVRKAK
jgi:DNA processing protein